MADGVLTERAASAALRTFFPEKLAAAAAAAANAKAGSGAVGGGKEEGGGDGVGGVGAGIATAAKRAGESVGDVAKQSWVGLALPGVTWTILGVINNNVVKSAKVSSITWCFDCKITL